MIQGLNLAETKISDKTLNHIFKFNHLEKLWIQKTEVSDQSIPVITNFKKLKQLDVSDTKITTEGIKRIKFKLPYCEIISSK